MERHRPGTAYSCDARRYGADKNLCPLHAAADQMAEALTDALAIVARWGFDSEESEPMIAKMTAALKAAGRIA